MGERERRGGGAISEASPGERSRRADIDAVVEVQLPHDLHERRDRLQVSRLERKVGAAQRLGEPRDLETGIVFGRIEPALRQGLTDRATDRAWLFLACDWRSARRCSRDEQVEIRLLPSDQCPHGRILPGCALARSFGERSRFVGHERFRSFADPDVQWILEHSDFCQTSNSPRRQEIVGPSKPRRRTPRHEIVLRDRLNGGSSRR